MSSAPSAFILLIANNALHDFIHSRFTYKLKALKSVSLSNKHMTYVFAHPKYESLICQGNFDVFLYEENS